MIPEKALAWQSGQLDYLGATCTHVKDYFRGNKSTPAHHLVNHTPLVFGQFILLAEPLPSISTYPACFTINF
jgi:hypothetical protein